MSARRRRATRAPLACLGCCLVALQTACGGGRLDALGPDALVVAFGDSLTAGNGVAPERAYPAVLASLSGRRVVNAGVSGETTAEGLERLPGVLAEHDADLVILLEGGNDILRDRSPLEAKRNLDAMIALAKGAGAQVVLVGVPKKSPFSRSAELYGELAEAHDVPLESGIVSRLLVRSAMKSDAVHFNEAGYAALAEAVHALLEDEGAL